VVLTANSPGEVAAWLSPAVAGLRRVAPQCTISVFVPPCTYASGTECSVIAAIPGVDGVYGPREFVRFVLFGVRPQGFEPGRTGAVCFLGGDLLYAVLLSRRLQLPAVAYTEGRVSWSGSYRRFFLPDEKARSRAIRQGARPEQLAVIGDLMLDAVRPVHGSRHEIRERLGLSEEESVVSLFPGSRPFEMRFMVPFFLSVAQRLLRQAGVPLSFLLSVAPFADDQAFIEVMQESPDPQVRITATEVPVSGPATAAWSLKAGELSVAAYRGLQYDLMLASDLAITIPGSNTAEMAHLGLPMVVVLPLNNAEEIPLDGLAGFLGGVPLVGRCLKRAAVLAAAKRTEYVAQPNRKAGRLLVPEIRGELDPDDVVEPALALLREPQRRQRMSRQLREVMGEAGAADRLAKAIVDVARTSDDPGVG
jgi:lipid A disaccharide synthetase